jgi:branched-chain amino acid transport system substrate-binding protein
MFSKSLMKLFGLFLVFAVAAGACGDSDDEPTAEGDSGGSTTEAPASGDETETTDPPADGGAEPETTEPPSDGGGDIDLASIGLWDDGPCDDSLDTLHVGIQTIFEAGVLTLIDQVQALDAAALAFNARGGANGHCIEVSSCDENAEANRVLECVREIDEAGVAITVNDTTSTSPDDAMDAYEAAGIPRFAISPGTTEYGNANHFPSTAGGAGTSIMMPAGLLAAGASKVAVVRVDLPAATALAGFFTNIFESEGLEVVADLPVPAGTTDYTQFILAAQDAGADSLAMPLGGQEAIQIMRAGQQLDADLLYSGSLGTFPWTDIQGLGDYAERLILNGVVQPATADLPAMDVLAADLAASGIDALQRPNLKTSPIRSWLGLYALLQIIRESGTEDFSRENLRTLAEGATDIPMLGLQADWTPNAQAESGAWTRYGDAEYFFYKMDFGLQFNGEDGNWTELSSASFEDTICGSLVGGTEPC